MIRKEMVLTHLIDRSYKKPKAKILAMLACGHDALARVASGAVWEGDTDIQVHPDERRSHEKAARVLHHAAVCAEEGRSL